MASVDVLDWNKKKVGSTELNADVFEQPVRKDILHTMVKWQLACRRQGTHKAKSRAVIVEKIIAYFTKGHRSFCKYRISLFT